MIRFKSLVPGIPDESIEELMGYIPFFFSEDDPRPAGEQLDENYAHGGGWHPLPKWEHLGDGVIKYPGDPKLRPVAVGQLRGEKIFFYNYSILAIFQPDGSFGASRVD